MLNSIPSHGFNIDDYDVDNGDDDYLEESETHSNLSDDDHNSNLAANFHDGELPTGVEADVNPDPEKLNQNQPNLADNDAIGLEVKAFKQFDTVQSDSDHYFAKPELYKKSLKAVKRPSKDWARRIQHEWKILEKDLPDSIYVRVYEDRMDLLRAVIIGPAGTPYHDGLYFFDAYFPHRYPDTPPLVHYHSGGIQLNPNLYESGKVCLSLLGTWSGGGCENWDPSNSTMLQVLVSIQALVLNAKPFYNEPAYVSLQNTQEGELSSLRYNEDTFLLACRAMLYTLRKPPKHFKDFVAAHYRSRGKAILMACRAYINGAQIGCLDEGGVQNVQEGDKSCSKTFARVHNRFSNTFKFSLRVLCNDLLKEFTVRGADCDEFLSNVKNRVGEGAGTSLEL